MKRITSIWAFALLIVSFLVSSFAQPGWGTVLEKMDTEKLTGRATHIVIGTVRNMTYARGPGRLIFTYVTLSVEQQIKGSSKDKEITFRYLGGRIGNDVLVVPGTPSFKKDQNVLVFLAPERRSNNLLVLGWVQGKYTIEGSRVLEKDVSLKAFVNEIKGILESQKTQR